MRRRLPLTFFPRVGVPLLLAGLALLFLGLGGAWDWSLQTGNVFLLVLIPKQAVSLLRLPLLVTGCAALAGAVRWGFRRPQPLDATTLASTRWRHRWALRFYPLVFALGLFLAFFGVLFAFDASVAGDRAPGGFALFLYLEYSGVLQRPFATLIGLALIGLGSRMATTYAFTQIMPRPPSTVLERLRAPLDSAKQGLE